MEAKFADIKEDNPMIAIKKLQMTNSIDDYEEQLDKSLIEVDLSEEAVMNCFIGSLRTDVQHRVLSL